MYKRVKKNQNGDRDKSQETETETERKRKLIRSIGNFKFFSYFQKESDPPGSAFACL